jgi:DNA-binding NtrC family response regulator
MTPCKLLLVDDDEAALFGYAQLLTKSGYLASEASNLLDAREKLSGEDFNLVILDLKLPDGNALEWIPELKKAYPDLPVIVVTGTGDIPTAVAAMKFGAENFLAKPVDPDNLELAVRTALELGALRKQKRVQRRLDKPAAPFFGNSRVVAGMSQSLRVAAESDTVVLMLGETGTGKGVLSRWIHEQSGRAREAFVELNCSSLKGDLLRSELFGHAKGSFTSAIADREGLVELADRGTLFLDEIGDMDLSVQAQLLKTLEERTYRRVGDNRLRRSDFRLVCATNKDLQKEVQTGAFRLDLFYRINVFPVTVPPLRDRIEDIQELIEHFLAEFGRPKCIPDSEIVAKLKEYSWPGNIRELRNMLERAVLLAQNGPLTIDCFPGLFVESCRQSATPGKVNGLRDVERDYVVKMVDACNGDKKKACKMLGISSATLYRKLGPANPQDQ